MAGLRGGWGNCQRPASCDRASANREPRRSSESNTCNGTARGQSLAAHFMHSYIVREGMASVSTARPSVYLLPCRSVCSGRGEQIIRSGGIRRNRQSPRYGDRRSSNRKTTRNSFSYACHRPRSSAATLTPAATSPRTLRKYRECEGEKNKQPKDCFHHTTPNDGR